MGFPHKSRCIHFFSGAAELIATDRVMNGLVIHTFMCGFAVELQPTYELSHEV
jgi:hypothetical protein